METLFTDIRYGFRGLLKRPAFSIIALITLALGIGVNTSLFTLFNIFMRPKPVKDPASLVQLTYEGTRRDDYFSFQSYTYVRDHTEVFSDVIANFQDKLLLGETIRGVEPEEIQGNFVSSNYLRTLGGETGLGRFFSAEENSVPGRDAVVVLSHKFWERRFAGDPQIVGRTLLLNGKPFTVIGVTKADFVGLRYDMPEVWLPLMMRSQMPTVYFEEVEPEKRDWFGGKDFQWVTLHARLKSGRGVADARAALALLTSQLNSTRGATEAKEIVNAVPISEVRGDNDVWPIMWGVLGASGLVLLIACSNIANMLLARAVARQREIAMRMALGASRWRVVRQLLTESLLLASAGGIAGLFLAWWSLNLLFNLLVNSYVGGNVAGGDLARLAIDLSPDTRVLLFCVGLSMVSGVAFGLAPALSATRPDLITVIKNESAGASGRVAGSWLRSGLVVAQVSLCLVLLIAAALLLRGLTRVLVSNRGYQAQKLLFVGYSLELSGYDMKRGELFQQQLIARLASLPGVQSVTQQANSGGRVTLKLPQVSGASAAEFDRVPWEQVPANYLESIGTPLVQGRGFTAEEARVKAPVIVVSESTARNLWPSDNPIGKTVRVERTRRDGIEVLFPEAQVIGVALDNQMYRVGQIPPFLFYTPQVQETEWLDTSLLIRTTGDAAAMKQLVRREAFALEPVLRLGVETMSELAARNNDISQTRIASELAAGLGGLALLLAAIGIYGVMAWSVSQRTREIGIRMALGAQGRDVMRLMMRRGMRLALIGVTIGLLLSLALTKLMKSLLFGLSATDPITFILVSALLSGVALLACYIPARRATKVDPLVALRYE
jgi:macrolide transport system ATP-binding/permease protein